MTGVFRHTDTEASHVTTVAEIGAMLPQAKDTWGHQTLERVRKDSLPETSGGSLAGTLILDFWLPEL